MDYAILLQAEQHCSLSHTLALWRLMALERAKIKSRNKQVRFEVIFFILMVLIFDLCNFRHFFWNFSLIAFVRLRIKRTTATSFKVWLVFLCALHEMYTLTLPQSHQSVVLILKVWLVVFKLVRPTLKQTLFGNFFQEPFEQLSDVFKEELGSREKANLNRELRKIDMDIFLPQLLQIILLNVKKDGETISTMM